MAKLGYARVSSTDQDLEIQVSALKAAGCEVVRAEKVSGTSMNGREELKTILDFIRAGDVLVVKRLDRLARSMADLQDIVRGLKAKGAELAILDQNIDTATAAGKAFLNMLGVFAEFESDLRRERQLEGIAKAKAAGKYKGRPATLDAAEVVRLKSGGFGRDRYFIEAWHRQIVGLPRGQRSPACLTAPNGRVTAFSEVCTSALQTSAERNGT